MTGFGTIFVHSGLKVYKTFQTNVSGITTTVSNSTLELFIESFFLKSSSIYQIRPIFTKEKKEQKIRIDILSPHLQAMSVFSTT